MELEAEYRSIGLENEKSLHASLKQWYAIPGDRLEVRVDGFVIDIVRDEILIEVQTKNFSAMGNKLRKLVEKHKIRLIHPIPIIKWIVKYDKDRTNIISRKKSPKKGSIYDLFDELIRLPDLMEKDNFSIELLMIIEEEIRSEDGKGSWRRKGVSLVDRKLLEVVEKVKLTEVEDFLMFIPKDLESPFSNKSLSKVAVITLVKARKATYCLKKMKLIEEVGKKGNELLFSLKASSNK